MTMANPKEREPHYEEMVSGKTTPECNHQETRTNLDGEVTFRTWNRIFCPDCGTIIEAPGKTRPFKLRPEQR